MTDSVTIDDVHERYKKACGRLGDQLVQALHRMSQNVWQHTALRPDAMVVLAGTSIVAALATAPRTPVHSWMFDRKSGVLHASVTRARIFVCEDQTLGQFAYRILLPTADDLLGRPTTETGTLTLELMP